MSSTDYALAPPVDPPSEPSPLLDFEGLRQAAQLIERLRQAQADDEKACPPTSSNYD